MLRQPQYTDYWSRYVTSYRGTGQSINTVKFSWGVHTKWGSIGQKWDDYLTSTVHWTGGWW
jgi:hypothetical protein